MMPVPYAVVSPPSYRVPGTYCISLIHPFLLGDERGLVWGDHLCWGAGCMVGVGVTGGGEANAEFPACTL